MKFIVVSGRSGSGKSTALHVLEDLGFYCIDNLPMGLLFPLIQNALSEDSEASPGRIAVSIDARNLSRQLADFESIHSKLVAAGVRPEILFTDATDQNLLQRFHATRRKHPLSSDTVSLPEAIRHEQTLLEPLSRLADLYIDTTGLSMYELRDMVRQRVAGRKDQELALLFQSFGYKHGVPVDSDYVFDVRCLPNPYWHPPLRAKTGLDQEVAEFLESEPLTLEMLTDIIRYLESWLPRFAMGNRNYMTISVGCTGGQHRSVYICDQLRQHFASQYKNVQIRHSEMHHLNPADN